MCVSLSIYLGTKKSTGVYILQKTMYSPDEDDYWRKKGKKKIRLREKMKAKKGKNKENNCVINGLLRLWVINKNKKISR